MRFSSFARFAVAVLLGAGVASAIAWRSNGNPFSRDARVLRDARASAAVLSVFYDDQARANGLDGDASYTNALARLRFDADRAATVADVSSASLRWTAILHARLSERLQDRAAQRILDLVRKDAAVRAGRAGVASFEPPVGVAPLGIADPSGVLTASGKAELVTDPTASLLQRRVEVESARGSAAFLSSADLSARVKTLEDERDALGKRVRQFEQGTGVTELEGAGVLIRVFDSKGRGEEAFVHDADIRNVVNELYAAGARGVDVSGMRLRPNSFIRCVGPVLQVDGQPVAVNPVVIKAVGDSEVLGRSLEILSRALREYDLKMTVEKKRVWLPAARP